MTRATIQKVQTLLAASGEYASAIDGLAGAQTEAAIRRLQDPRVEALRGQRRVYAAGQLILGRLGYEPGSIDGYWGHNTENAYQSWLYAKTHGGKELVLPRVPLGASVKGPFPKQSEVTSFYGIPGPRIAEQLVRVPTYRMRIDWNTKQTVSNISLHRKCADSAEAALKEIEKHYGYDTLVRLGLDRFAGSYNHRKMRGGSKWSMHAYGCAIDFHAGPNGLTARCPKALFCKPEYKIFFDIWEAHGWTSLGRAIGRDWMHVQAASL